MGDSLIQQQSFEFALSIIRLYKKLQARQEYIVSPQLLRSGTRIGIDIEEAGTAKSEENFVSRIQAAAQNARETRYWLRLLQASKLADIDVSHELGQIEELLHLLGSETAGQQKLNPS